jgi:hypothetical protein
LPHLARILGLATGRAPTATTVSTTTYASNVFVHDLPSYAGVRAAAREERVHGVGEIGHTVGLELDIFVIHSRCSGIRGRRATEPDAQQNLERPEARPASGEVSLEHRSR